MLHNHKKNHGKPLITLTEARIRALNTIIKIVQLRYYEQEIMSLKNSSLIKGPLANLLPFIDANGLLRVGGRLENAPYSQDLCHPIILPGSSLFVELYIRHLHIKYYHASCSFIISFVATKYRIVGLYRVVKRIVKKCTRCARYRGQVAQQLMGQLPISRVSENRPFSAIGTDLAGAFMVKCTRHRSVKLIKMYAAFFVCDSTRAIHIELLSELSAESYIIAFWRFMARRGCVSQVRSDNATNFQATSKYVASLHPLLESFAANQGIKWIFIPPPHQGGLHEAGVKSAKRHLLRITNGSVFNQKELTTLFTEIEAILNSRPLCYVEKPNHERFILTPAHFLVGSELLTPPIPSRSEVPIKLSDHYESFRNRIHSFWKNWRSDYLSQLQIRSKWMQPYPNLKVNDVVLIKNKGPPGSWPYGLIVDVHPDMSGLVRNVDILSKGSVQKAAIQNLIPLVNGDELSSSSEAE